MASLVFERAKAQALGKIFLEEIAVTMGCKTAELGKEWVALADAFAWCVFTRDESERVAMVGVAAMAILSLP